MVKVTKPYYWVTTTWVVMAKKSNREKATKIRTYEGFEQGGQVDTS